MFPILRILVLSFVLAACAAPVDTRPAPVVRSDPAALRGPLAALPGAVPAPEPAVGVVYPGEVLFADGAAVPFPGGVEVLDPLANLIAAERGLRWTAVVRASGGASSEEDRRLAEKRGELLTRYFARRGIGPERLLLTTEAAAGAPLQVMVEPSEPAAVEKTTREGK